jgi:hypothetical protein
MLYFITSVFFFHNFIIEQKYNFLKGSKLLVCGTEKHFEERKLKNALRKNTNHPQVRHYIPKSQTTIARASHTKATSVGKRCETS